jgi:hypothetical protein
LRLLWLEEDAKKPEEVLRDPNVSEEEANDVYYGEMNSTSDQADAINADTGIGDSTNSDC